MRIFSLGVVGLMTIFAIAGIVDIIFLRGKLGLGAEFKKGFELIGPLCLAMAGIISLVPLVSQIAKSTFVPVYQALGLDPSMAVASFLAIDMGGYQLAHAVGQDVQIADWAGIVYASMMGATIIFTIPVGIAYVEKSRVGAFSKGIICGLSSIPFGALVGGLMMGINAADVIRNLLIPLAMSVVLMICLIRFPMGTLKGFKVLSVFISALSLIGLGLAIIRDLLLLPLAEMGGILSQDCIFLKLIAPASEGITVAGSIGLVLSGTFPFVFCLKKILAGQIKRLSKRIGFSDAGLMGVLLSMANNMALFASFDKMNDKELTVNMAFTVSAAFVIGDHLAFAAANAPDTIGPMIAAKLISGISAALLAYILCGTIDKNHLQA